MFLKLGVLQDDKFYERVKDLIIWKNSHGDWTTVSDYLERSKDKKIYYASSDKSSPLLEMYKEKNIEILFTSSPVDTALISNLERKLSTTFQRIDGSLDESLLDTSREKTLLDAEGKTEASRIADFIRTSLDQKEIEVEAKSLNSDTLPGLLVLDEKERRLRDYMALTAQDKSAFSLPTKKTFIVNTNSPLIQKLLKLQQKEPSIAKEMAKGIYDLSLLSQRETEPGDMDRIISHQTQILEKLANLLV